MSWTEHSTPEKFFGKGYSLASSELKLTSDGHAGVTVGTVTADDTTEVLTSVGHCLRVGDKVQFTTTTTLPAGLALATNYFVRSTPDADTFTVSASVGGALLDITDTGTGTHSIVVMGLLPEITNAEANATTGDSRRVIYGLLEMLYSKMQNLDSADRPTKLTILRATYEDTNTGEFVKTFTITVRASATGFEVADE